MPFYERGPVRIHYEEVGSGFPLLLIPGGGLNSALSSWQTASPFNPMERYKDDFRCICADLRNANPGQSSGPLEIDRPWDAYTDDQLGLMDHLGIREFLVMGFCIGGPMIHNLIRRAPERVVAAAMMQPSGFRPEIPDLFYQNNIKGWGPAAVREAPRRHDGHGPRLPHQHVHEPRRLRVHRVARLRALHPDAAADRARRRAGAPVQGRDGGGQPRPERRGDHLSLEGFAGAHRRGRGARAALPQGARAGSRRALSEDNKALVRVSLTDKQRSNMKWTSRPSEGEWGSSPTSIPGFPLCSILTSRMEVLLLHRA